MSPINIQLLSPAVLPCKVAEHAKCAKKEFPPHFHLCSTKPWLPLSLHTIPTRKAARIKRSPSMPSLLPAHSQRCSSFLLTHYNALLLLGFFFCNHYPIAAWEVESLVGLGKNPNNIALNAPSCDLVLSFHLLGKFKCNIQTSRAKFTPCHWYSKDNFLRSRHLSKLISWLNFSFHSLDPCTPYLWVLFSNLLKAPSGTAVPWKPCGTPVQRQMHVTHTEIHVKLGTEWSEVWSIKGSL